MNYSSIYNTIYNKIVSSRLYNDSTTYINIYPMRAMLSTAQQYFTKNKNKYPGSLERISIRIGSKLPLLHSIYSQDKHRVIINILDALLINSRIINGKPVNKNTITMGVSNKTGRVIIRVNKLYNTDHNTVSLPIIPKAIERVFEGWGEQVELEVYSDKNLLLALKETNTSQQPVEI
ncbi:hypothetical protein NEOKW01_1692 [Nematocida sp. AWRm80]|nr:hypothetical protein NEOKW01_1692 [Nematocida sp. AWRm80]